ncbi:MAG: RnfABCDGE type electron transport complex subunit G [Deltaproteobacteria bacterium]|nr:RnfABCDGE type electron transport complex subunit G [Deltaproteobacteria bacterium]MBW2151897.1 RnfABCDGE type electron transport complex subunit G [Deltaproteobacteria bacterium]
MKEMIKMVVVLTVLSAFSGSLLAAIHHKLSERIDYQKLKFVQGPAIKEILEGTSNDPLSDRFKLNINGAEKSFFVGVFDGNPNAVAFETFGKGYGGELGVMVGIDITNDKILGVRVTTHSETPGMGARAKTDLEFVEQFKGQPIAETFKVRSDGGQVDALSGATFTSRGVSAALTEAGELYQKLKPKIKEKLKSYKKM